MAKYILTDAASASAAFYAAYSVLVNSAYILLWRVALNERELLKDGVTDAEIKKITRGLVTPLPIYAAAAVLAFVNAWITVTLTTLLWIYLACVALVACGVFCALSFCGAVFVPFRASRVLGLLLWRYALRVRGDSTPALALCTSR